MKLVGTRLGNEMRLEGTSDKCGTRQEMPCMGEFRFLFLGENPAPKFKWTLLAYQGRKPSKKGDRSCIGILSIWYLRVVHVLVKCER